MLSRSRSRKPIKNVMPGVRSSGLATVESRWGLDCGTQRAVKKSPVSVGKGPSFGRYCSICEVKTSNVLPHVWRVVNLDKAHSPYPERIKPRMLVKGYQ